MCSNVSVTEGEWADGDVRAVAEARLCRAVEGPLQGPPGLSPRWTGRPLEGCVQSHCGSDCEQAPSGGRAENTKNPNTGEAEGKEPQMGRRSQRQDLETGEFGAFQKQKEAQSDHQLVIKGQWHEMGTQGPHPARHLDFIWNRRKATDTRIFL